MKSIVMTAQNVRDFIKARTITVKKSSPDSPLEAGDVVFIREPWNRLKNPSNGEDTVRFNYASNATAEPVAYKWASPVAMPADAIRYYGRVTLVAETPDTPGEWEITVEAISKAEAEATESSRYDLAEADEESTNLSDAPQDVKEQILKNAETLVEREVNNTTEGGLSEADPESEEPAITMGTCRFCGQITNVGGRWSSQEDADAAALDTCDCPRAKSERRVIEQIDDARDRIQRLFGPAAIELSFAPIDEREPVELLNELVELVARRFISSATVQIRGYCRAKVSFTSKGKIKVERSEARSYQLEAGE